MDDFLTYEAEVSERKSGKSLCASPGCRPTESDDGLCANLNCQVEADRHCDDETLAKAREICTMPHGADPAETFVTDILEDQVGTLPLGSTMLIRFFLFEEFFPMWNQAAMNWIMQAVAEEAADTIEVGTDTFLRRVSPRKASSRCCCRSGS